MSATVSAGMLAFAARAYRAMKDIDVEEYPSRVFYESRNGEPQALEHLMFRRHWYYGTWVYFERGHYSCRFDEVLLADMVKKEDEAQERAKSAVAAVVA